MVFIWFAFFLQSGKCTARSLSLCAPCLSGLCDLFLFHFTRFPISDPVCFGSLSHRLVFFLSPFAFAVCCRVSGKKKKNWSKKPTMLLLKTSLGCKIKPIEILLWRAGDAMRCGDGTGVHNETKKPKDLKNLNPKNQSLIEIYIIASERKLTITGIHHMGMRAQHWVRRG